MFDKIKKILKEIVNPGIGINEDTALGDLDLDSLGKIETVINLEDVFDVDLPDDIFEDTKTIKDLEKEIENRKS